MLVWDHNIAFQGETMQLPHKLTEIIRKFDQHKILAADVEQIHQRLLAAVQGVAVEQHETRKDLAIKLLHDIKTAIREEICDSENGALREGYQHLLNKSMTAEGVESAAFVALDVITSIDPLLAVPSVVSSVALWLVKTDLSKWCKESIPVQKGES